jgi:membrane protease YdiL (CAAX protease family)
VPKLTRPVIRNEVLLLLGVSLGFSAIDAILSLIRAETAPQALNHQTIALNPSYTPDRPYLDLAINLERLIPLVVPALFAIHLLNRDGRAFDRLGLDRRRPWFDLGSGLGLAALIGIPGLGLYLLARHLNLSADIAAASLGNTWWAVPVLVLISAGNGFLEEVVVVGYLINRLRDLGWARWQAVAASALLRGTYHLYQGPGAFIGNAIMGVVFGLFFLRFKRVLPLVIAHTLIDVVATVGYTLAHGHIPGV